MIEKLARFFRAIANPYFLGIVAITAIVLLVLEINQRGTICELLAVFLEHGKCFLSDNNLACNLPDLKGKRYRWDVEGVWPTHPGSEDKGYADLNIVVDEVRISIQK